MIGRELELRVCVRGDTRRGSRLALHELRIHSKGIAKCLQLHIMHNFFKQKFTGKSMFDSGRGENLWGGGRVVLKWSALEACMHMHMHDYIYVIYKRRVCSF